jgi:hypothetical protein
LHGVLVLRRIAAPTAKTTIDAEMPRLISVSVFIVASPLVVQRTMTIDDSFGKLRRRIVLNQTPTPTDFRPETEHFKFSRYAAVPLRPDRYIGSPPTIL